MPPDWTVATDDMVTVRFLHCIQCGRAADGLHLCTHRAGGVWCIPLCERCFRAEPTCERIITRLAERESHAC